MRFKSQQHKSTFKKAIRKKDKKDTRFMKITRTACLPTTESPLS